jgi:two-component system, LytTR family, sensor kinase
VQAVIDETKRREDRIILGSIVVFWVIHLIVLGIFALITSGNFLGLSMRRIPAIFVAAGLCYSIHLLLGPVRPRGFWKTALVAGFLAVGSAAIYGAFTTWIFFYAKGFGLVPAEIGPYTIRMLVEDAFIWLYSFLSWTAFYLALVYSFDVRDRERRLARVEALAHKAQVQALRYQLNPHFLFNTLNALSSMIWERELERAEGMLMSLSAFLRTTLEIEPGDDVTLEQEIALQQLYLEIEQIRFSERLQVEIDIPEEIRDAPVPCLILQPLIENAIKYAVAPSRQPTRVRIAGRRSGNELTLEVVDDGRAEAVVGGTGIGLANVRSRLTARFGDRCSFEAGPLPRGFGVKLTMPLGGRR